MVRPALAVGVLAVQGGVDRHLDALARCGAQASRVKTPAELRDVDAIVLPGGESTAIGKQLDATGLLADIRTRIARGMPVLGTCAGMVLLAGAVADGLPGQHLLGGLDIDVRRNAYGRQVASFETDLFVSGIARADVPFPAVFIRAPRIERAGPGVKVLATDADGCPVAVRERAVMATSFHPELTADDRMHEMFLDLAARASGLFAS